MTNEFEDVINRVPEVTIQTLLHATSGQSNDKVIFVVGAPSSGKFVFSQALRLTRPVLTLCNYHLPSMSSVDNASKNIETWLENNQAVQYRALKDTRINLDAVMALQIRVKKPLIFYTSSLSNIEVIDESLIEQIVVLPFADRVTEVDRDMYSTIGRFKKDGTQLLNACYNPNFEREPVTLDKSFKSFSVIKPK